MSATHRSQASCGWRPGLQAVATILLLAVVAPLAADEVMIGFRKVEDVKVNGFDGKWLEYRERDGIMRFKKIGEISRILINGRTDFSNAEIELAAGRFDKALAQYKIALAGANEGWLKKLIEHRSATAKHRKADPTSRPRPILDRPETTTAPATAPAERENGPVQPAYDPIAEVLTESLTSSEAFGDYVQKLPLPPGQRKDFKTMTSLQKADAAKSFERQRRAWVKNLTTLLGKKLDWGELICLDVTSEDARGRVGVLACWRRYRPRGGNGEDEIRHKLKQDYFVWTLLPLNRNRHLLQLRQGAPLDITGTVEAFRLFRLLTRAVKYSVPDFDKELVINLGPFVPVRYHPRLPKSAIDYQKLFEGFDPKKPGLWVQLVKGTVRRGPDIEPPEEEPRDDRRRRFPGPEGPDPEPYPEESMPPMPGP